MKFAAASLCFLSLLLSACTSYDKTQLLGVVEYSVKTTKSYDSSWHNSSLRVNSRYIFYSANSSKEKKALLGDYYFVSWYDKDPSQDVTVQMYYTQSASGSTVLSRTQTAKAPRRGTGSQKMEFFFNGEERAKRGDVLSWKVDIYVGNELVDSKQSYLWQ